MPDFIHYCTEDQARLFATWITTRGGLAVWNSLMIGDDTQWTTPVQAPDGTPVTKPHMYAASQPTRIITDPAQVGVVTLVEFKRFVPTLRMGSQGMSVKLTDDSNEILNRLLEQAGKGATWYADYDAGEAVVLAPDPAKTRSLAEWV